ncbi:hypothetical protein KIM372_06890 [Bombiscardovia nodaiensis]|uniref:ABC3 transporter permease C-terminal domain-containing protein n=1 Tax=Bombiscardovia nodaiensis TaxID=2932181 RepID=A0ABM8B7C7_9BIFI|nr:hypothetical protein KIM372_06890 [Bombiscardovia nodaiensis]
MQTQGSGVKLGQRIQLADRHDKMQTVTVVASFASEHSPFELYLLGLPGTVEGSGVDKPQLSTSVVARSDQVEHLGRALKGLRGQPGTSLLTKEEFIRQQSRSRSQEMDSFLIFMLASAALAGIFLLQSCAIAVHERRRENIRLMALGISRLQLTAVMALEAALDVLSALVVSALILVGVLLPQVLELAQLKLPAGLVTLPFGSFAAVSVGLLLLAAVSSGIFTHISLRRQPSVAA